MHVRKCASRQKIERTGRAAFFLAAQLQAASRENAYVYGESASGAWHLNTPRLITNQAQQAVWRHDNTEPFADSVPDEDPSSLGAFAFPLRFPGQYADKETNLHYNYHRDFDPGTGRYVQSDPIGLRAGLNTYLYVGAGPLRHVDPFGLKSRVCCKTIPLAFGKRHCYVETVKDSGTKSTLGLHGGVFLDMPGCGQVFPNADFDMNDDNDPKCGEWNDGCLTDQCVQDNADLYPNPSNYAYLFGAPNSNSFAGEIAKSCKLKRPDGLSDNEVPGWSGRPAATPFPDIPQTLPVWPKICPPTQPTPVTGD